MTLLNWGLIGAGDIAPKRIAPALRELLSCRLVAVSRARAELAESFAREFGAPRGDHAWRDLLVDKEIDAVYIATPVFLHIGNCMSRHFCKGCGERNIKQAKKFSGEPFGLRVF